jgi:DNA-binding NarL/FixJ family response regulator
MKERRSELEYRSKAHKQHSGPFRFIVILGDIQMSTRILIVDDHEVVREGVRSIIVNARPQWEICGEATNGQEAIDAAMKFRPDVILLDITMPVLNGLDAAIRISGLGLSSRILIFTMHESGELAKDARRVGARGYVTKSDAGRHLVRAIETLLSGHTFFGGPEKSEPGKKDPQSGILFRIALGFA